MENPNKGSRLKTTVIILEGGLLLLVILQLILSFLGDIVVNIIIISITLIIAGIQTAVVIFIT